MSKSDGSFNVPKEQLAVVFEETAGPLLIKKIPVRDPGPDEVLVNIKYSGLCHTDLHAWKGDWPLETKKPLVGGHEGAGVIVKCGSNVVGLKPGDYAGIKWLNGSCGQCEYCLNGFEPNCPQAQLSGFTVDGSFQEYAIGKAAHVAHIPKECNLADAAPILCAGLTVYKALKVSDAKPGQWVAIPGAGGGLGHLAIQYARAMGFRVLAIDTGADKEKLCKDLGAEVFLDFEKSKNIVEDIQKATNGGPHASIITAASEIPYHQAADYARPQGVIVCVGLPGDAEFKSSVFFTVLKCITIRGSYVGNRADSSEALDFLARGLVKPIYKMLPLSEVEHVYHDLEKGHIVGRIVLDLSK